MLRRALAGALTGAELASLYSAFDQVGGIVVVRIPAALAPRRRLIGEALLREVRPARSVYCQASDVGGDYRTRRLELIAGEDSTRTTYREHGCSLEVDVEAAYFSPRLSAERGRIAGLVSDGEVVLNMFGGVGAFSVVAARSRECLVYSVDSNPAAAALCAANAAGNRLAGRVVPILGDAAAEAALLPCAADRTLMVLPERAGEFLPQAAAATRDGGVIHYYTHVHADSRGAAPAAAERRYLSEAPARSEVLCSRAVRAVGPRYYQAVVDARISK